MQFSALKRKQQVDYTISMINIPPGLGEVLVSESLSIDQKCDAIMKFAWPVVHIGCEHAGLMEPGQIAEEDAHLICDMIRTGRVLIVEHCVHNTQEGVDGYTAPAQ